MTSKILLKIDASTPTGLRQLREIRGLNLHEVANEAGIDPTWLSRAERTLLPMTAEQMSAIREAIETIVTRREEQTK